ncbi:predicted protein [Sclerotinia sclerotiorum 1980 UF-70]|uniref:Uncharacterized protein n=1 Tax=Sclerotinia sclerotiorum (strain ATCC 18683 / 1980 / Ss-1) TaxID=665079 RepID=A7F4Z1_SCLS1|nr:predicted protein [Sclerotinia sclerotiorum 1980 UF-70]EDN97812.1 predicted protein [Sclerotinia sclerotiorum 1980 UF-70]
MHASAISVPVPQDNIQEMEIMRYEKPTSSSALKFSMPF